METHSNPIELAPVSAWASSIRVPFEGGVVTVGDTRKPPEPTGNPFDVAWALRSGAISTDANTLMLSHRKIAVKETTPSHLAKIIPRLKPGDIVTISLAPGEEPSPALLTAYQMQFPGNKVLLAKYGQKFHVLRDGTVQVAEEAA